MTRTYVRQVVGPREGIIGELFRLRDENRLLENADRPGHSDHLVHPDGPFGQSLYVHTRELRPGAWSDKHAHQNEALFYILDGEGYDIHDGRRYDWASGDVVIVPPGCVHQHFNSSQTKPARMLVIKTKPLYTLLSLLFDAVVEKGGRPR